MYESAPELDAQIAVTLPGTQAGLLPGDWWFSNIYVQMDG